MFAYLKEAAYRIGEAVILIPGDRKIEAAIGFLVIALVVSLIF